MKIRQRYIIAQSQVIKFLKIVEENVLTYYQALLINERIYWWFTCSVYITTYLRMLKYFMCTYMHPQDKTFRYWLKWKHFLVAGIINTEIISCFLSKNEYNTNRITVRYRENKTRGT